MKLFVPLPCFCAPADLVPAVLPRLRWMAAALPLAATAQTAEPAETGGWLAGQFVVVAVLLLCAWAALYVLRQKRRAGGGEASTLKVVGSTALGTRERVVVLRAGERSFLLGVTAQQVSMLAELHEAPAAPPPATAADKPMF
jgi:flagellar protein FliO/FliZ